MPEHNNENLPIAFGLVLGAGAATGIGAAVVFFPTLVHYANRKTLAVSLGFSAGVMCYVSFVEIFQKSVKSFTAGGYEPNDAYKYATLCYFAGVLVMIGLNFTVTTVLRGNHRHHDVPSFSDRKKNPTAFVNTSFENKDSNNNNVNNNDNNDDDKENQSNNDNRQADVSPCPCCAENPAEQLERLQDMANEMKEADEVGDDAVGLNDEPYSCDGEEAKNQAKDDNDDVENAALKEAQEKESKKIMHMSINTAIAIALHNFPEGLATFVAALNDAKVGAVLAVAIAIHNVPEGLCVALPLYYATGNRWKAFMFGILSGLSEPFAAFLGWLVLANTFSDPLYGGLFGGVAGMMVIISVKELLPTAHRYDPEDHVVTYSFMIGMAVMALSLVLFVL